MPLSVSTLLVLVSLRLPYCPGEVQPPLLPAAACPPPHMSLGKAGCSLTLVSMPTPLTPPLPMEDSAGGGGYTHGPGKEEPLPMRQHVRGRARWASAIR